MLNCYRIFILLLFVNLQVYGQRIEKSGVADSIRWNEFTLHSNQWGLYKIKKGNYQQRIYKENGIVGWDWQVPTKSYGVIGYPMIQIGVDPWTKLINVNKSNFYQDLTKTRQFDVTYSAKLNTTKEKYNLAFDFWLHTSEKVGYENIATEVMIWEDYQKFKPFGKKKGTILTSNGSYTVYIGKIYKKELQKGWNYIAFVRNQPRTQGSLNIMDFISYLKSNQLLGEGIYLSSFEFGTEILNASGSIQIQQYDINIQ